MGKITRNNKTLDMDFIVSNKDRMDEFNLGIMHGESIFRVIGMGKI